MAVHYENLGNTVVITISRPQRRNAIDQETAMQLAAAWQRFATDEAGHVGILTGAGGNFSAGADLKAMDLHPGEGGFLGFTRLRCPKPTIAAIDGYCVAGGLEMALWCDLRVAGDGAVFGCFERRWGVPLVDGGTQRLPHIVGLGRALDMILTGRAVDAAEAHDIGLVNRVVASGEELQAALEIADTIAAAPSQTVRSDRAALYDGLDASLRGGLSAEDRRGRQVMSVAFAGAARFAAGEGRHGSRVSDL
ncbi:MAG: crotonase/enoyl-CoA hydratase family protein [Acidimicrobiia bacterium]